MPRQKNRERERKRKRTKGRKREKISERDREREREKEKERERRTHMRTHTYEHAHKQACARSGAHINLAVPSDTPQGQGTCIHLYGVQMSWNLSPVPFPRTPVTPPNGPRHSVHAHTHSFLSHSPFTPFVPFSFPAVLPLTIWQSLHWLLCGWCLQRLQTLSLCIGSSVSGARKCCCHHILYTCSSAVCARRDCCHHSICTCSSVAAGRRGRCGCSLSPGACPSGILCLPATAASGPSVRSDILPSRAPVPRFCFARPDRYALVKRDNITERRASQPWKAGQPRGCSIQGQLVRTTLASLLCSRWGTVTSFAFSRPFVVGPHGFAHLARC